MILPMMSKLPFPEDQDKYFTTHGVGALDPEREASVFAGFADAVGILDVGGLHPSKATLRVEEMNPTSTRAQINYFFRYEFPTAVDFTNGGEYDAVFVDFEMSRGPVPAHSLTVLVGPGRMHHWSQLIPAEDRLQPFTAVFPFAQFRSSGAPYTNVPDFQIRVYSYKDNSELEIRLESIRIGALPTGDYNGNGLVEQSDLDLVLTHWGEPSRPTDRAAGWFGDAPDGPIDQGTLDSVLTNWGTAVAPSGPEAAAGAIPEPHTWMLALIAAIIAAAASRHGKRHRGSR